MGYLPLFYLHQCFDFLLTGANRRFKAIFSIDIYDAKMNHTYISFFTVAAFPQLPPSRVRAASSCPPASLVASARGRAGLSHFYNYHFAPLPSQSLLDGEILMFSFRCDYGLLPLILLFGRHRCRRAKRYRTFFSHCHRRGFRM